MRNQRAAALLSIIVFAGTTLVFILAMAAIVSQTSRTISQSKWDADLRNAAEIGMDYAIDQYNQNPSACLLDPPAGQASLQTVLPAPYTAAMCSTQPITVIITVKQISNPTDWQALQQISSIYNTQLDPIPTTPPSTSLTVSGYRVIESKAGRGGISRTLRSFIEAQFTPPPNGPGSVGSGGTAPPQQSYFSNPMFSNGPMTLAGLPGKLLTVSGTGSQGPVSQNGISPNQYYSYNLNLTTNTIANIGSGSLVAGNVNVLSAGSVGSTANVNGQLYGTLTSNGDLGASIQSTGGTNSTPGDNVLALADSVGNTGTPNPNSPRSGVNQNPTIADSNPGTAQFGMAPMQSPSSSAVTFDPNAPSFPTGDYLATGFSTLDMSNPISMGIGGSNAAPTRVFLQDTGSGNPAQISTAFLNTPNTANFPQNFQIWYGGTNDVNITLSSGNPFNGVIYAPHARVNINGQGSFNGDIVAGSINAIADQGNVNVNINTDVSASTSQGTFNPTTSALNHTLDPSLLIQGWQPVSWQELKQ